MELFKLLGTVAVETQDANKKIDDTSKKAEGLGKGFGETAEKAAKFATKIVAVAEAAVTAIGGLAISSSISMDKAFNTLQASTGIATENLEKYKGVLQAVYNDNYGESFEDIAKAMSTIAQTSGDIEADEMKELTESAFLLRDTFDMDINESMRAVNMLMDQFGISGKEAFNLIIQGAQKGLNKNDDLLDSINEYSVHYKQLGYTAEDFFNSLSNGTEAGTFSVDKLGDAMKEFGIRVKDTSTTTTDAFTLLNLDADDFRKKFAEGGEVAQEATSKLIETLFAMDDKVAQNAAGVGLFGTMWEDLGADGVRALMDVEGGIKTATDALTQMSEVKYDDLKSDMEGLKRKLETSIITPLGKKIEPVVSRIIKTVEKKMPQIQKLAVKLGDTVEKGFDKLGPAIEWVIDDALPVLIDILGFCIDNFDTLATVITLVVGSLKTFSIISKVTTAIQGASGAFGVFNAVLSANPIGAVVTGLGLLAGGIALLATSLEDEQTATEKVREENERNLQAIKDQNQAIEDNRNAIDEKATADLAQIERTEDLWQELQKLCDESGNVKDADKDRANFILNELNNALGTEYELTGNQIQNYKDLQAEIQNTIDAKKAEILFSAAEEKYTKAIENKTQAEEDLKNKLYEVAEQQGKCNKLHEEYYQKLADYQNEKISRSDWVEYIDMLNAENQELKGLKDEYSELNTRVVGYYTDISQYEDAASLMAQKKYTEAYELMEGYNQMYLKASDIAGKTTEEQMKQLEQQVIDAGVQRDILKQQMEDCADSEKAMYQRMYDDAVEHFDDMKGELEKAGGKYTNTLDISIKSKMFSVYKTLESAGIESINSFSKGAKSSGSALGNSLHSLGKTTGTQLADGVSKGVSEGQQKFNNVLGNFINSGVSFMKKIAGIRSPARLFADEIGAFIPSGVGKGVEDNEEDATEPMQDLINNMVVKSGNKSTTLNATMVNPSSGIPSLNDANIVNKLEQVISAIKDMKIYLNDETLVGAIAPAMDAELGNIYTGKARGR